MKANDEKHSWKKHSKNSIESAEGKCFCINAISNWKWVLFKATNMRKAMWKIYKHFHVKTLFGVVVYEDASSLLRLNNRNNEENKKHTKTRGGADAIANQRYRRRREISWGKKQLTMYEKTGFFFHRRLVCEVYGLETCIFSSFTNIEALTRNVDIVRIYCFLKNIFFFYKFSTR